MHFLLVCVLEWCDKGRNEKKKTHRTTLYQPCCCCYCSFLKNQWTLINCEMIYSIIVELQHSKEHNNVFIKWQLYFRHSINFLNSKICQPKIGSTIHFMLPASSHIYLFIYNLTRLNYRKYFDIFFDSFRFALFRFCFALLQSEHIIIH